MEKYKFDYSERYAIWKVLGPKCRWCTEPVEYSDCQIDHIIPEFLLDNEELRKKVLANYGLDDSFKINSFNNWIPCHSHCNFSKNDKVIRGANVFLELLDDVKSKVTEIERICNSWKTEPKTAKLIATIESGIATGIIDKTIVTRMFTEINDTLAPVAGLTGSTINNQIFYTYPKDVWIVKEKKEELFTLIKDGMIGIAPVPSNIDPKVV